MHGYLSNGYLNSLSNFNYKKAEKTTSLRPLLDQPWIMTKIAPNIMKVSMHSYLPNVPINLRLNFSFDKLLKRKLRCAVLPRFGLKGVKIFWNVSKVCMDVCSSNGHPNLWSNLNSKKLFEKETPSCSFDRVGLKGGQNISKHRGIWHACLSIQYSSKHMIRFKFSESGQS